MTGKSAAHASILLDVKITPVPNGETRTSRVSPPLRVYYFITGERSQETQEPSCRTTFG